jgi:hypothetical protein
MLLKSLSSPTEHSGYLHSGRPFSCVAIPPITPILQRRPKFFASDSTVGRSCASNPLSGLTTAVKVLSPHVEPDDSPANYLIKLLQAAGQPHHAETNQHVQFFIQWS